MKLIKNPWNKLFFELAKSSNNSIKITSPFVKENIVSGLFDVKKEDVTVSLITSFKLMNYYMGVSDLSALELIIDKKGIVSNFQKLHSKIYIFDDSTAIISSGNFTNGGLVNNYEYGVLIDDNNVTDIVKDYSDLLNNEITGTISIDEISQARDILSKVPKSRKITLPTIEIQDQKEEVEIFTGGVESIASSLQGWKLAVFNCVLRIPENTFSLNDINKFVPDLKLEFPGNHHIEAKIRQQLQMLRDVGLIEFLGSGMYKKLWI